MRRWGSLLITIWLAFGLPSLLGWGAVVRWSDTGTVRFARVWTWVAERLTFPLVLAPVTDRCWEWLRAGSPATATVGFVALVAVWAAMFALPLVIVAAWWHWLGRRLSSAPPHPYDPTALPFVATPSPAASLARALYGVTIPLALAAYAVRWLLRLCLPALVVFAVVWTLVMGWFVLALTQGSYGGRVADLWYLRNDIWHGYLDTLHVPRVRDEAWGGWWVSVIDRSMEMSRAEWDAFTGTWYHDDALRDLLVYVAARHALGAALVVATLSLLRRLLSAGAMRGG